MYQYLRGGGWEEALKEFTAFENIQRWPRAYLLRNPLIPNHCSLVSCSKKHRRVTRSITCDDPVFSGGNGGVEVVVFQR